MGTYEQYMEDQGTLAKPMFQEPSQKVEGAYQRSVQFEDEALTRLKAFLEAYQEFTGSDRQIIDAYRRDGVKASILAAMEEDLQTVALLGRRRATAMGILLLDDLRILAEVVSRRTANLDSDGQ